MKVFFDANVHVAAAIRGETAEEMIRATLAAGWRVHSCTHLMDEIDRVLVHYLGFSRRFARLTRSRIVRLTELVDPGIGSQMIRRTRRSFRPRWRPAQITSSRTIDTCSHSIRLKISGSSQ